MQSAVEVQAVEVRALCEPWGGVPQIMDEDVEEDVLLRSRHWPKER